MQSFTVRYVSIDPAFGGQTASWPPAFRDLVAARLAEMCGPRIGAAAERLAALPALRDETLARALEQQARTTARILPSDTAALTKLRLYNDALGYADLPRIASLTDAGQAVRALNDAWDLAVRWMLQQGPWSFSIRAVAIAPYGARVPTFGYANAFLKPDDWLQTVTVALDDRFQRGALQYVDEAGYWFSDEPALFIRYVSLLPAYGLNVERWPPSFGEVVGLRMGELAGPRLGMKPAEIAGLVALRGAAMKRLRANDALNTPPVFPPVGSWVRSRGGWSGEDGRRGGGGASRPPVPLTGDSTLGGDTSLPVNTDFIPRI